MLVQWIFKWVKMKRILSHSMPLHGSTVLHPYGISFSCHQAYLVTHITKCICAFTRKLSWKFQFDSIFDWRKTKHCTASRWQRTAIVQKLTTFVKNVCCALLVRDAFHLDEHGWCYIKSVPNESGWLDLHLRYIAHNVPKSCSTLFITLTNFWAICMADKPDKVVGCIFFHFEMRRGLIR